MKNVLEAHSSCEKVKGLLLIRPSFVVGVGMNFRPLDNRIICSSVSCLSDRFLICCLKAVFVSPFFSVSFCDF